jgi:hypothetical protein
LLAGPKLEFELSCKVSSEIEDVVESGIKSTRWPVLEKLRELLQETKPPPEELAKRLRTVERDVILPVKAVFVLLLAYYLYFSS